MTRTPALETLIRTSIMHPYTSFFLLSFLTIFLSFDFCRVTYSSTALPESASSPELLAAQTQTGRKSRPDRGSSRRSFNHFQDETVFPQLL